MKAKAKSPVEVGSKVTVSTRWKSNLYYKEYEDNTYTGTVVKSERYDPPDTFRLKDDSPMVSRLITHYSVIKIVLDGKEHDPKVLFDTKPLKQETKAIAGSNGKVYSVTVMGGKALNCDCVGFRFHKTCKHLALV